MNKMLDFMHMNLVVNLFPTAQTLTFDLQIK